MPIDPLQSIIKLALYDQHQKEMSLPLWSSKKIEKNSSSFLCPTCRFCPLWVQQWHSLGQLGWGRAPPAEDRTGFQLWSSSVLGVPWVGAPAVLPGLQPSCGPCRDRSPARRWCSQRGHHPDGSDCWRLGSWGSGPLRCCGCRVGRKEPVLWRWEPELLKESTSVFAFPGFLTINCVFFISDDHFWKHAAQLSNFLCIFPYCYVCYIITLFFFLLELSNSSQIWINFCPCNMWYSAFQRSVQR